ncbi:hypothetical protein CH359_18415 [Leptospira meyeri]|nr:hypothetical protein CH359_18415 [Leptospira meyeri]PJZ95208.1 hypothetical protein CH358_18380 [Leptospira meyeri]PKA12547.1 hypothetical protein CH372_08770 [Leptospira meyeri]PKA25814.1 hypothetical protein CH381_13705 [Leptospira sp. mixed culture ATI2-C-A1]
MRNEKSKKRIIFGKYAGVPSFVLIGNFELLPLFVCAKDRSGNPFVKRKIGAKSLVVFCFVVWPELDSMRPIGGRFFSFGCEKSLYYFCNFVRLFVTPLTG